MLYHSLYRKRVSPALYSKAPTPITEQTLGRAAQQAKEKEKETMPAPAARQTRMTYNRCALRNVPTTILGSDPPCTKQHLQEGNDADDAAARTCPRVSPGTRRVEGNEDHRHPPGRNGGTRRRHRTGAGRSGKDFSQLQTPPPNQIGANQPAHRPLACATPVATPPTPSH